MWQTGIVIHDDGSFDLPVLLFDEFGDGFERLRARGDRVYIGSTPDESAFFMVVESCTYLPTSSEIIVSERHKDPTENITTVFSARLIDGNKMLFVSGSYGPGATSATEAAVLGRMGAQAAREFDSVTGRARRRGPR